MTFIFEFRNTSTCFTDYVISQKMTSHVIQYHLSQTFQRIVSALWYSHPVASDKDDVIKQYEFSAHDSCIQLISVACSSLCRTRIFSFDKNKDPYEVPSSSLTRAQEYMYRVHDLSEETPFFLSFRWNVDAHWIQQLFYSALRLLSLRCLLQCIVSSASDITEPFFEFSLGPFFNLTHHRAGPISLHTEWFWRDFRLHSPTDKKKKKKKKIYIYKYMYMFIYMPLLTYRHPFCSFWWSLVRQLSS